MADFKSKEWKQRWARIAAWTPLEQASLCCGWDPEGERQNQPLYNQVLDDIMRAVKVPDSDLARAVVETPRWPATDAEAFYKHTPLLKPTIAWKWCRAHYPATFLLSAEDFAQDAPLETKERNILYRIIAALNRGPKHSVREIAALTEDMGFLLVNAPSEIT